MTAADWTVLAGAIALGALELRLFAWLAADPADRARRERAACPSPAVPEDLQ